MVKKYLIGITIILFALMVFGLIEGTITGYFVSNKESNERIVIYFPNNADLPNPEQGTVVFDFSFPKASFKVGNKSAEVLMFMNSDTLPGLKVGYDVITKKIVAGLPAMQTSEVEIIDGGRHKIAYVFNRAEKKQAIWLDEKMMVQGEFTGESSEDALTGYAIMQKWRYVESPISIDVKFSESCDSEGDVCEIEW